MSGQRHRRAIALVLFLAPSAFGANVLKEEIERYGRDIAAIARAPLAWDAATWRRAGVVAAIDGAAFAADDRIERFAQRNRHDEVADFFTPFGGRRALNISAAVLITGVVSHHPARRESGRDAIEASILADGILTPVLKRVVGRARPSGTDDRSFPSGHATNAFAVASVFAARSNGWVVPTIAYTLATGVAAARVNDDVHFTSDVIAGAAIGMSIGRSIVARHRKEETRGKAPRVSWTIVPLDRGVAVYFFHSPD